MNTNFNVDIDETVEPIRRIQAVAVRELMENRELIQEMERARQTLYISDSRQERSQRTLLDLLFQVHQPGPPRYQATNPRDRVYALLGMAADAKELAIKPDYILSCAAVYVVTAAAILRQPDGPSLLFYSQFPKSMALPSWVPDWTREFRPSLGLGLMYDDWREGCFSASGDRPAELSISFPAGLLRMSYLSIAGCQFQAVEHTLLEVWPVKTAGLAGLPRFLDALLKFVTTYATWYGTPGAAGRRVPGGFLDALMRLPTLDLAVDKLFRAERASASTFATFFRIWQAYHDGLDIWLSHGDRSSASEPPLEVRQGADPRWQHPLKHDYQFKAGGPLWYLRNATTWQDGRRVFATSEGFLGVGPDHVRPGDRVCILYGLDVPFVLRPVGDRYELVGEAWVHGIMDGEFMEEDRATEVFVIQ